MTPSTRDLWSTPASFIKHVHAVLTFIDLDPMTTDEANETVAAGHILTPHEDAFSVPWHCHTLYLNPPYSAGLVKKSLNKFLREWWSGHIAHSAIVLTSAVHDTRYGQELLVECDAVCWPNRRIQFDPPPGVAKSSNRFNQMVTYFGPDPMRFDAVFGTHVGKVFHNRAGERS